METANSCNEIYRILSNEILNLAIVPGTILDKHKLCDRFSVSRTPIQCVLQRLQENSLVQIRPYKGTMVTLLDFDIINQVIYNRVALETMVLRDFTKTCNPLDIEQVRHALNKMKLIGSGEHPDLFQFYKADIYMHEIWFQAMRKMYLWNFFEKTQVDYYRFKMLDILANNIRDVINEHEQMLDIIETKEVDRLEELIKKHLYGGVRRLGQSLFTKYKDYFVQHDYNGTEMSF